MTGLTVGLLLSSGFIVTMPRNILIDPPSQYLVMSWCAVNPVSMKARRFSRIASRPFHSATPRRHVASSTKQSKPLPKVLSSISFQKASSQSGGVVLGIVSVVIAFSRADIDQPLSQYRPSGEPPTITSEVIEREV